MLINDTDVLNVLFAESAQMFLVLGTDYITTDRCYKKKHLRRKDENKAPLIVQFHQCEMKLKPKFN